MESTWTFVGIVIIFALLLLFLGALLMGASAVMWYRGRAEQAQNAMADHNPAFPPVAGGAFATGPSVAANSVSSELKDQGSSLSKIEDDEDAFARTDILSEHHLGELRAMLQGDDDDLGRTELFSKDDPRFAEVAFMDDDDDDY